MSLQHAAHHLASQGRGPDDTLVHMTHREVQSLQDIARANGGSLTINPETGLVEAGFLSNLLPMIAGAALTAATGGAAAPWMIGLGVGGIQAARTGSLQKGLMAGLGAYGGAGLGNALTSAAGTTNAGAATAENVAGRAVPPIEQVNPSNFSAIDKLKYGIQGLGTEAGRSAALNSLGGGFGAAKTAGMALAPVLADTGEQKAPPSDNEQYNYDYNPGRVENPDEGYTGAFTGERTHFRPSYTRLPNTRITGMSHGGVAHFDAGGPTDKDKLAGIQGAAAAKNYVPFEYPAVAAQPAGSIQPVATNPFYTMKGQSADAYRYLMGAGPQGEGPTKVIPPVITDIATGVNTETHTGLFTGIYTGLPTDIFTDIFTDTDTDFGTDTDVFTDTLTDTDVFTDTLTDTDVFTDTDTLTDTDVFTDTDTITDTDVFTDTDTLTDTDVFTDTDTLTDTDVFTDTDTLTDTDVFTDTLTDTDVFTDTLTDTDVFTDILTDTLTDTDIFTFVPTEITDTDIFTYVPVDSATDTDIFTYVPIDSATDTDIYTYIAPDVTDTDLFNGGGDPFNLNESFNSRNDFSGGYGGGSKGWDDNGMSTSAYADGGITAGGIHSDPLSSSGPITTVGTFANGGLSAAYYNLGGYSDGGRLLRGPGDGVSDSIPATINNKQPARLADGEFVVPARIVSELGNGSTEAGARKLYAMMERIQAARGKTVGRNRVAANSRSDRHLPA